PAEDRQIGHDVAAPIFGEGEDVDRLRQITKYLDVLRLELQVPFVLLDLLLVAGHLGFVRVVRHTGFKLSASNFHCAVPSHVDGANYTQRKTLARGSVSARSGARHSRFERPSGTAHARRAGALSELAGGSLQPPPRPGRGRRRGTRQTCRGGSGRTRLRTRLGMW